MTYDTWHVTDDMWKVGGGEHSLKIVTSLALTVWVLWCFEGFEEKDHWLMP